MSILNAWIDRDTALVSCDTEVKLPGGAVSEISKMAVLVSMNAVIGYRGHMLFLGPLVGSCHAAFGDFDELLKTLPELLKSCFNLAAAEAVRRGVTDMDSDLAGFDHEEVVVVGWSPSHGRMIGRQYVQRDRGTGFVSSAIDPHYCTPWIGRDDGSLGDLPEPKTPEAMTQLAKAQVRFARQNFPKASAGGRLILASVDRNSVTINGGVVL